MTNVTTNDWNTESGSERLMLQSCRSAAKHPDTVIVTYETAL